MSGPNDRTVRQRSLEMFTRLGDVLYGGTSYADIYQAVCSAARELVTGCDHASVLMERDGSWSTVAATDSVARTIDQLEQDAGAGPCVDAIIDDTPQLAPDLTDPDAPWPQLRAILLASTQIRGMLGFQIVQERRKVAALNLFSDRPGGFSDHDVDQAAIIAAYCTVALQASRDRLEARSLREGLASNREIGKAIGLLMAYHRISDDDAFAILRTTSNEMNIKLSEVADRIVTGHHSQLSH